MIANGNSPRETQMEVKGVAKRFGYKPYWKHVLNDCSFTMRDRELTVLIGPSGCGKSTLINLIAGYEKPDEGEILINGRPIGGPGADRPGGFSGDGPFPLDEHL